MKRFHLLSVIPTPEDSTSLYRGIGPLAELAHRTQGELAVTVANRVDWPTIATADALFVQRPYLPEHVQVIQMFKQWRRPVWVDYDDFLFEVPTDNPTFLRYSNQKTQTAIVDSLLAADVVTVSTPYLRRFLLPILKMAREKGEPQSDDKIIVIPNALLDDGCDHESFWAPFRETKTVAWRGSETHQRDLFHHGPGFMHAAAQHTDWQFQFLGYNPWFLTENLPHDRTSIIPPQDPMVFRQLFRKLTPEIVVVPLHDSRFNRAKSNIAYLEAVTAGAITVAPDWEEWRRPGVITYSEAGDLGDALAEAMSLSPERRREIHAHAVEHVKKHETLLTRNLQRLELLRILDSFRNLRKFPSERELAMTEPFFDARATL